MNSPTLAIQVHIKKTETLLTHSLNHGNKE